jgi:DNA-binding XRE family transcriptional regulator
MASKKDYVITQGQARMARALLGLTTAEVGESSSVNKNTVVAIENGRLGHGAKLGELMEFYEKIGIYFTPAMPDLLQPGVAMRWGFDREKIEKALDEARKETKQKKERGTDTEDADADADAKAWDEEEELEEMPGLDVIDVDDLRRYWAEDGRWERLSEPSRKAIAQRIGAPGSEGVHQ